MKKLTLRATAALLFGLVVLPLATQGQFRSKDDLEAVLAIVSTQPLTVLLEPEDPKTLRQLADKPVELAQYQAYLAQRDAQWRELGARLWKFSPSLVLRSTADFKNITKARDGSSVILHYTKSLKATYSSPYSQGHYLAYEMECSVFNDANERLFWQGPAPVGGVLLPGDIATTLRGLQSRAARQAATSSLPVALRRAIGDLHYLKEQDFLRDKTLLIDAADLRDQLTEAGVRTLYPHPVRVASLDTIEAAIVRGDARYTYLRRLGSPYSGPGLLVMDVASGSLLCSLFEDNGLDKKFLKRLAEQAAVNPKDVERRAKLEKEIKEASK